MNQNNNPDKETAVTVESTVNKEQLEIAKKRAYKNSIYISLIIVSIAVIIVSIMFLTAPKPDYNKFNTATTAYLSQVGNVISYRPSTYGYDIIYITVDESSWRGSKLDKVKYCDAIRKTLTVYGWRNNIISDKETISVIFETESGVRLAEPDGMQFGKYKIFY